MKNILIINANPKQKSLSKELADAYARACEAEGIRTAAIHISDLTFNPDLSGGYDQILPLEEDLEKVQAAIKAADHITIVIPVWWGTMPAKLKGLFDRTLLPGFGFQYKSGSMIPERLLNGKTARIIVTMDSPVWYYRWMVKDPIIKDLKKPILEFCGIKVKGVNRFGPVISSTTDKRKKWMEKAARAGKIDSKK